MFDLTPKDLEELDRVTKEVQELQKKWLEGTATLDNIPELHRERLEELKKLLSKRG